MKQHYAPCTASRIAKAHALDGFSVSITAGARESQLGGSDTNILHVTRPDDTNGNAARAALAAAWAETFPKQNNRKTL